MKRSLLLIASLLILQTGFSYSWKSYGPEGVKANKIIFGLHNVLIVDTGFYMIDYQQQYSFFPFIISDACELNNNIILMATPSNSYSDGIYEFNTNTFEFSIIHYCMNSNFMERLYSSGYFFVGTDDGLLKSEDGYNWENVEYFNGKSCKSINPNTYFYYGDDIIAIVTDEPYNNVYVSYDNCLTWQQLLTDNVKIKEVTAYYNKLIGICNENNSYSGIYGCDFYETLFTLIIPTENINTLGFDNTDHLFMGFHSSEKVDYGIAMYEPYNLQFMNQGLPDLNIKAIGAPFDWVGGNIVYCCTENGIYYSDDFAVSINEPNKEEARLNIFPNPVTGNAKITISGLAEDCIIIYNIEGKKVDEIKPDSFSNGQIILNWNKGNLLAGVYYLVAKTNTGVLMRKFVIN